MKNTYGLLMLVIVLTVGLGACTANEPAELTEAERAEIQAAVEEQIQVLSQASAARDADLFSSVMAPDVEFVNGPRKYSGIDAARQNVTEVYAGFPSWDSSWEPAEVRVLSREWVSFVSQVTVRRQDTDGQWYESDPYSYLTGLFHETDGKWELTLGQFSGAFRQVQGTAEE